MIARFSARGRITIPADLRRTTGIAPGDAVEFAFENGCIIMTKIQPIDQLWNVGQSAMMTEWASQDENCYNQIS